MTLSVEPADELSKGDSLGRYEIIEQIAVGGMAQIYLGRVRGTAGFDKLVAIKRILPRVALDHTFVEMFLAEARLAATLRHPNIADVFDVGNDAGSYFFAMEFIHGQDLRAIKAEAEAVGRGVPLDIAVAIVSGITSALSYAHAKVGPTGPLNLVHRDVSPSNIIVSFDGAVKLVDFGIARAETNASATITRTGQLKGKIPYMSPEQCRARPLDGRADLFSLGVVLYEMTTGSRPFDGKGDFDTLERIVHGSMRLPSEIRGHYPKSLEQIVLRMLANKRSERYQTADELLQDLERLSSEDGMFASAFALGKYMRDLFPEEANMPLGAQDDDDVPTNPPETIIEIADPSPDTSTRKYPRAQQTSGMFAVDTTTANMSIPPGAPPPSDDFKVSFRAPSGTRNVPTLRPETASPFYEETSTVSRAETHADMFPPFDPIASRGHEILKAIDPGIVEDREISLEIMGELLQRAATWSEAGHLDDSIIAIDLILSADRTMPGVLDLLAKNFPFMTAVFERFLGDPRRIIALSEQLDELAELSLDRRAMYLLSLLEGTMSAGDLVERADMPVVEAYRHLCNMILRRVVVLV